MGISLATALTIQGSEVICEAGGPCKTNGKYAGWIRLDVDHWRPLLNTEPIYDTPEAARTAMEEIIQSVRETDLTPQKNKLQTIVGEAGPLIGKVIDAAKPARN